MSMSFKTSASCSTVCGTGSSTICTLGANSASCSTVCRCTRSCGSCGSARLAGRVPPHGVFLVEQLEERRIPGHSGPRRVVRGGGPCRLLSPRRAACCSCLPTNSSLNFGRNGAEEWWKVSARTMRTVCRSCFGDKRGRRSRRLMAAPADAFNIGHVNRKGLTRDHTQKGLCMCMATWNGSVSKNLFFLGKKKRTSETPSDPALPSHRALTTVSGRGLHPDVSPQSADVHNHAKTAPVEFQLFLSPFSLHRVCFCATTGMLTTVENCNCGTHGFLPYLDHPRHLKMHNDGRRQPCQRTTLRILTVFCTVRTSVPVSVA